MKVQLLKKVAFWELGYATSASS